MKWRNELPIISESITCKTADIVDIMNEGGAILTDIADLLEGSSSHSPAPQTGMPSMPELLLNALMSKTAIPTSNAESKENKVGEIHEEELSPPPE